MMSETTVSTSNDEVSLATRLKCRFMGHDWIYYRNKGERECHRCWLRETYTVEETHEDETAEKGQIRLQVEDDGTLLAEQYQTTGWGENSEYWQWFPIASFPTNDESLVQLKEQIDRYVRGTPEEHESNEG